MKNLSYIAFKWQNYALYKSIKINAIASQIAENAWKTLCQYDIYINLKRIM
jgi:hypothetical protein